MSIAIGYVVGPLAARRHRRRRAPCRPRSSSAARHRDARRASLVLVAPRPRPAAARTASAARRDGRRRRATSLRRASSGASRRRASRRSPTATSRRRSSSSCRSISSSRSTSPRETTILIPAFFARGHAPLLERRRPPRRSLRPPPRDARARRASGIAMILGFVFLDVVPARCAVAVFVAGATLASISPVSLALQGVVTRRARLQPLERDLQRVLRRGDAPRPADLEPDLRGATAAAAMLFHLAALWGAFVVFASCSARRPGRTPGPGVRRRTKRRSRPEVARSPRGRRDAVAALKLTRTLTREVSLEDSLHAVTEVALDLVPGDHASVRLLDGAKSSLLSGARSGRGAAERPLAFNRSEGLLGWVVEHRQPRRSPTSRRIAASSPTRGRASRFDRRSPSRSGPGAT